MVVVVVVDGHLGWEGWEESNVTPHRLVDLKQSMVRPLSCRERNRSTSRNNRVTLLHNLLQRHERPFKKRTLIHLPTGMDDDQVQQQQQQWQQKKSRFWRQ